jgi:transposase
LDVSPPRDRPSDSRLGYRDLGSDYFTRRIDSPDARKRRLIQELEALGHKVTIEPIAA